MADFSDDNFKIFKQSKLDRLKERLQSCNCSRREYALGGLLIIAILVVIILAALLGRAHHQESRRPKVCNTAGCLKVTSLMGKYMNTSVDPCTNFYQFACGSYDDLTTAKASDSVHRTAVTDLSDKADAVVKELLESPAVRTAKWTAEHKLKTMFDTCIDQSSREKLLGRPFIENILPKMHGWYVLDTWNSTKFDLNEALKTVHTDLWTSAFWTNGIGYDEGNYEKPLLKLQPAGYGKHIRLISYILKKDKKSIDDYKLYMRNVANLIARDSKLTIPDLDTNIETFITDAITIETKIVILYANSFYELYTNVPQEESKIKLKDLEARPGNIINWLEQMQYEYPNYLNKDSYVLLSKKGYIFGLSGLINNLNATDRNRMLHNFFIWRLLETYAPRLSYEYYHADTKYYEDQTGNKYFYPSPWHYCLSYVSFSMTDALSSLYVRKYFKGENKQMAQELMSNVVQELTADLDDIEFLDLETKTLAKAKLEKTKYLVGYPDYFASQDAVDTIYQSLVVNSTDYFQNVLNMNRFANIDFDNELSGKRVAARWQNFHSFRVYLGNDLARNTIYAPAGVLQFPFYDSTNPQFANFGSLGAVFGRLVTHVVDEYGSKNTAENKYVEKGWWTETTLKKYNTTKQCALEFYNRTMGTFVNTQGDKKTIRINAKRYYIEAIAKTSGVKLALQAYRKWKTQNGEEDMAPGLGLTNIQTFFVANAQTYCFNRNARQAYIRAEQGRVQEDYAINLGLSQLPDFSEAFKCSADSKMNAPNKCSYF